MQQKIDDLASEIRCGYYRQWRAANKDKVRQYNENYWRRQAEKKLKQKTERQEVTADVK